jgi:SHS family lactate transporter-like MFS transporter
VLALAGAVLLIPLWAFAPSLPLLILGAFAMQFLVQGAWGVIPAHITELSPDGVRGSLPGFAYQCGVLIASVMPWLAARLAHGWTYAEWSRGWGRSGAGWGTARRPLVQCTPGSSAAAR